MINRKIFFNEYKNTLDPNRKLDQTEVDALDIFLDFYDKDVAYFTTVQWAYVFATVYHETGATFLPVRESPRASESWRKSKLRYHPFYGRGYVQLTWDYNYKTYGKKLGIDLVKYPDLAMEYKNSWFILIDGFKNGVFTSKKMADYINSKKIDFKNARRIINGTDKADLIAGYAETFLQILNNAKQV